MTAVHSGFVFKCTTCGMILGRGDQKHGCEGRTLRRIKRTTLTMTPEEEREFEVFQRERGRHVIPCMKELPLVFSDQPYFQGQVKKRAQLTEPHSIKKKKKRQDGAKAAVLSPKPGKDTYAMPSKEVPLPLEKVTSSRVTNSTKKKDSTPPETPAALRKSFKRLFGDTLSDSEDEPEEGQNTALSSPDVSISEPPSTSTPVKSVTSTTVYEYDRVDSGTQTNAVSEQDPKSASIAQVQRERVGLDIGGEIFITSKSTLLRFPKSLFGRMLKDPTVSPCYTKDQADVYFLDRDPEFFRIILHFLRDGPRNINCHLPSDPVTLRKIHIEAVYYGLDTLADVIGNMMCVTLMGHSQFLEE